MIKASKRTALTAIVAAASLAGLSSSAFAADARPTIPGANPAALGSQPNIVIHDAVLPLRSNARSAAANDMIPSNASRGSYPANGMMIKIAVSPAYQPDPAESQSWANFLGNLPQHGDAAYLTAYFAPLSEMQQLCGSDADACYDPNVSVLVLLAEPAPDGATPEELAAHEFGHHIANRRKNTPWSADAWGPKRWATYQGICKGISSGKFFADGANNHYELDPAEGWAETYRVAAGQNPTEWPITSPAFKHGPPALSAALSDATNPWPGNVAQSSTRSFAKGALRTQWLRLGVPVDGRVSVAVAAGRGIDVDLDLFDSTGRKRLASSVRYGRNDSLATNVCGQRTVVVHFKLASGRGSYKATTNTPAP